jgi:glucosamine 6-phosphate synthetase-like amidotransferase/phosphosugar isomerase protein
MCALFGFTDYGGITQKRTLKKLIRSLSIESESRGKDATGIAYLSSDELKIFKTNKPAHTLHLYFPPGTKCVMGHTRMATNGLPEHNQNNHPFTGIAGETHFSLAHNGVLFNDKLLRITKKLPETSIQCDSYIATQLLETSLILDFDNLKSMAETVEGTFTFTILDDKNNLFLVKGESPIFLAHFEKLGLYVYSSTETIFTKALLRTKLKHEPFKQIQVNSGDILKIDAQGVIEKSTFDNWYNSFLFSPRVPYSWRYSSNHDHIENNHFDELVELGSFVGVNRNEITSLFDIGYSMFEIEELLSEPDLLREHLCGIYEDDPDFCFDY